MNKKELLKKRQELDSAKAEIEEQLYTVKNVC